MTLLSFKNIAYGAAIFLILPACTPMEPKFGFNEGDPVYPLSKKEKILKQVHFDRLEAQRDDIKTGELASAEEKYTKNPKDVSNALTYAVLLRKVGMQAQAKMVLQPFAVDRDSSTEEVLLEYSKINLLLGDFKTAQIFAQEASFVNDAAEANMILGVVLDSQGHHEAAERNFRKAMDAAGLDVGLRAKIMNNLGLNLMLQGRQAEAKEIMEMVDADALDSNSYLKFKANSALITEA